MTASDRTPLPRTTTVAIVAARSDVIAASIDAHTGLGVNEYGCVCGWENLDGTDTAQLVHAAEMVRAAIHTPEVTEAARREVRALLPDLPAGKDVTVAIAALDGGLRAAMPWVESVDGWVRG